MMPCQDDRGQATVFVIGMTFVALAVTAFAVEGTRAFLMRRTLQNAADGAALAGASQLDRDTYYSSGGTVASIDPVRGRIAVTAWLERRGLDVDAGMRVAPEQVWVDLRTDMPTSLLGIIGINSVPVSADATAEPAVGDPPG